MQQLRTAHSAADTASAQQLRAGRAGAGRGLMMMMMMMMMILTMTERSEAAALRRRQNFRAEGAGEIFILVNPADG